LTLKFIKESKNSKKKQRLGFAEKCKFLLDNFLFKKFFDNNKKKLLTITKILQT